jgi:hypothetical protein
MVRNLLTSISPHRRRNEMDTPSLAHFRKYGLCQECFCWPCLCGAQPRLEPDED